MIATNSQLDCLIEFLTPLSKIQIKIYDEHATDLRKCRAIGGWYTHR